MMSRNPLGRERGRVLHGVQVGGGGRRNKSIETPWRRASVPGLRYLFIVSYPVGTVVGRHSECYRLIHGCEGDRDGVLPQHRQLHLLIHLQMKKPGLSRPLPLSSPPHNTHTHTPPFLTYHKAQNPSWLGTEGGVKSF